MKRLVCTIIILCAAGALFAQERQTLTVEAAVKYALANSYQIKSGAIDLELKKRASDVGWNSLLPTVQGTGTLARQNDLSSQEKSANAQIDMANGMTQMMNALTSITHLPVMPLQDHIKLEERDHWAGVFGVTVSWNFNPAMLEQIKVAHANYEAGKISWAQVQKSVELNVKKMFYGLLLAEESLTIQEMSLDNAEKHMKQAESNYKNGRIPEVQYVQAQVAYKTQMPQVLKARQTIDENLDMFAFILGMKPGSKIALSGEIKPAYKDLDAQQLITEHIDGRLDLVSLDKTRSVLLRQKQALAFSIYSPSLALSWNYQGTQSFSKDADLQKGGALSATIAYNITNLLPWSASQQQLKDVKANITKLEIGREQARDAAVNDVIKKVNALSFSKSQIVVMEENVALAQKAFDFTDDMYSKGLSDQIAVNDAQTSLDQAKLGLLNEHYTYLTGLLDLEDALNTQL